MVLSQNLRASLQAAHAVRLLPTLISRPSSGGRSGGTLVLPASSEVPSLAEDINLPVPARKTGTTLRLRADIEAPSSAARGGMPERYYIKPLKYYLFDYSVLCAAHAPIISCSGWAGSTTSHASAPRSARWRCMECPTCINLPPGIMNHFRGVCRVDLKLHVRKLAENDRRGGRPTDSTSSKPSGDWGGKGRSLISLSLGVKWIRDRVPSPAQH